MSGLSAGRSADDRGSSLVELVVSVLVFGLFAGGLATSVLQTTRYTRESTVRETAGQEASLAMRQVARDLRTAVRVGPVGDPPVAFAPVQAGPPVVGATATQVAFYASVEPTVLLERLYVHNGALFRDTKIPDAGTAYPFLRYTSPDPLRTTTSRLTPPGLVTTASFSYELRGTVGTVTSVAPADLGRITAVTVTMSADRDGPGGVRAILLETTVRPFNL